MTRRAACRCMLPHLEARRAFNCFTSRERCCTALPACTTKTLCDAVCCASCWVHGACMQFALHRRCDDQRLFQYLDFSCNDASRHATGAGSFLVEASAPEMLCACRTMSLSTITLKQHQNHQRKASRTVHSGSTDHCVSQSYTTGTCMWDCHTCSSSSGAASACKAPHM